MKKIWSWWVHWATVITHALILLVFFCSTWWWRPGWILADWIPASINKGLHTPTNSDTYREVYFLRFAITLFVALIVLLWVFSAFRGIRQVVIDGRMWWLIGLGLLTFWVWLSVGWAVENRAVARSQAAVWVLTYGFVLVVSCNGPKPRWVSIAIVSGMIFHSVIAITQSALQRQINLTWVDEHILKLGVGLYEFTTDPQISGTSVVQSDGVRYLRPYGLTPHPNLLAGGLVMGLLSASWMWLKPELRRIVAWVTVLGLWALFLTFSRASVGGLVIGASFIVGLWVLNQNWHSNTILSALVLVLATAATFYLFNQRLVNVRTGSGDEGRASVEEISVAERTIYLEQARQMIRESSWRGVGIANFPWVSYRILQNDPRNLDVGGQYVHNIYYLAVAEVGIIGCILAAITLLVGGFMILRRWQAKALSPIAIGLWGGVCAWLATGWFEFFAWALFTHQILFWGAMAVALIPDHDKSN